MMVRKSIPHLFMQLRSYGCVKDADILKTRDGFWVLYQSLSDILLEKGIVDFPDSKGARLACDKFFDDWFLYAVPDGTGEAYSLLKLREQEHDAQDGAPADGDMPGITISFIRFSEGLLLQCIETPTDENRTRLDEEINRVVAYRGQSHHKALKKYFADPKSEGPYLVADMYVKHIASFAKDGCLEVPQRYREILQQSISYPKSAKFARLPRFLDAVNRQAGKVICDNRKIYIQNPAAPTAHEAAAILATHTGNTSLHSFAAEVEYHAKFLTPLAKIRIPFFGRSIYASAIRADMTVGDPEFEGPAPFYQAESKIVKRQRALHPAAGVGAIMRIG